MKTTKPLFGILTITAALAIQVQAQTFLTNGLVAYYPFNGNANDASGNGNNGQALSAVLTTDRFGISGHAYQFNGVNADILAANQSYLSFPNGGDLTISIWATLNSMPSSVMHLIGMDNGAFDNPKWLLDYGQLALPPPFVGPSNYVHFIVTGAKGDGQAYFLQSTLYTPALGTWHQYVVSKEGSDYALYIDGLKTSGATNYMNDAGVVRVGVTGPSAIPSGITAPLSMGEAEGAGWLDGKLDDVRIYNRALSAAEVQQLYAYESVPSCVSPAAGLVSWWPGEGNANDIAGTNNGTLEGGVTFTNGQVGQAFNLDGVSGYVEVASNSNLNPAGSFSIEGWIFPRQDQLQTIIAKWADTPADLNQRSYTFNVTPNEGLQFAISDWTHQWDVAFQSFYTPNNVYALNTWSHVAAVYDQPAGARRIYVNGVEVAERIDPPITVTNSTAKVGIGANLFSDTGSRGYFDGLIDELSFYSTALSTAEIQAIYNAGSAGKCVPPQPPNCAPPPSGLVGWWPGDGNANDIAGTNNGTLVGGTSFASGEVGQAFSFDGVGALVQVPSSPALSFGLQSPMTVELWAYRTGSASSMHILGKRNVCNGDSSQIDYQMYFNMPSGQGLGFGGGSGSAADSGLDMPMNTWTHLAGTFDGSNLCLYVNGTLRATGLGALGPPNTAPLLIGGSADCDKFVGLIDEVSIYSCALASNEIAEIYDAGSAGKCRLPRAATASAVLSYDFVVGATITDGGYGYTNTPTVKIIGGGGSGAQAVAVLSNGVVVGITITDAGIGYTSAPMVVIDPPFIPNPVLSIAPMSFLAFSNLSVGGAYQLQQLVGWYWTNQPVSFTATNALDTQMVAGVASAGDYRLTLNPVPAQAFATATVEYGFVIHATVTSGGSGYVTIPEVNIVGGGGSNATAVANLSGGVVTSITITDAGIGYTNTPTIQIAPPPAAAVSPTVLPVMRLDSASLAPYDNYQVQFKPDLGGAWENWSGGLFSPTDVTNSQYLFITNGVGFFRLQYVP